MAVVAELFTCGAQGQEMQAHESFSLVEGRGVEGDRYFKGCGVYSGLLEKGRQLTLISADSAEEVLDVPAFSHLTMRHLRRNVAVRGMTHADLIACIGGEVDLGSCRVLVHRFCPPCPYIERLIGATNTKEATWYTTGVNCEVLEGGTLSVGDGVRPRPDTIDARRCDFGGKPPDFFILPSALHARGERVLGTPLPKDLLLQEGRRGRDAAAVTEWVARNEAALLADFHRRAASASAGALRRRAAVVAALAMGTVFLRALMTKRL